MRKVLVVGGAGLIGISLTRRLQRAGHQVTVVDDLSALAGCDPRSQPVLQRAVELFRVETELVTTDVSAEPDRLTALFKRGFDTVIYLPALRATDCDRHQDRAIDEQIVGLVNCLRSAAASQVEQFVLASSSFVYGHFDHATEASPIAPLDTYGRLKVAAEQIVRSFGEAGRLSYTIMRPINVYGPLDTRPRYGGALLLAALAGEDFTIRGADRRYVFTYVEDSARGFAAVVGHDGARNETFNFGTRSSVTAREFAEAVSTLLPTFRPIEGEAPKNMPHSDASPRRGIFDSSKAADKLGLELSYTLADGVAHFANVLRTVRDEGRLPKELGADRSELVART